MELRHLFPDANAGEADYDENHGQNNDKFFQAIAVPAQPAWATMIKVQPDQSFNLHNVQKRIDPDKK